MYYRAMKAGVGVLRSGSAEATARRLFAVLALMAVAVLTGLVVAPTAIAQSNSVTSTAAAGNQGLTWDDIKALPDWSGVWEPGRNRPSGAAQYSEQPPLTPKWQKKFETVRKIAAAGGDVPSRAYHCIALGPPAEMGGPETLLEFLFTPARVTIDSSQGWVRRIYLGQKLPEDPDLTFQGSSVGHWEGATLVVETVGLDPGDEFMYGMPIGQGGHVVERIHLVDPNTLQLDVAVDAAESLKSTYRYSQLYQRTNFPMGEFDCAQNNRDVDPNTGRQGFDISPKR